MQPWVIIETPTMYLPEQKLCPYCNEALPWILKRKRACPSCGNAIYLKENPEDHVHYAITETERDHFEERWKEVWTDQQRQKHLEDAAEAKSRGDEIGYWHYRAEAESANGNYGEAERCYQRAQDQAKADSSYGLLRNEVYALGEMFRRKGDALKALENFIDVAYLDYCNVSNNFAHQEEMRSEQREVTPEFKDLLEGFLDPDKTMAPAVLDWLFELSSEAELFGDHLSELALRRMHPLRAKLKLPFFPSEAWDFISSELQNYERQQAIRSQEQEEEQQLSAEELASKLHAEGGQWWQFRDLGRALSSEGKRDLAWGCFNRALLEAAKIGRTCETIYPDMGTHLLKEGRTRYGLECLLLAVREYGVIAERFPQSALDMPKYLDKEIAKAIKKLGMGSEFQHSLITFSLNSDQEKVRERVKELFGS